MKKKSFQPHLFEPPGRSTGNRIIFMDSLIKHLLTLKEHWLYYRRAHDVIIPKSALIIIGVTNVCRTVLFFYLNSICISAGCLLVGFTRKKIFRMLIS